MAFVYAVKSAYEVTIRLASRFERIEAKIRRDRPANVKIVPGYF